MQANFNDNWQSLSYFCNFSKSFYVKLDFKGKISKRGKFKQGCNIFIKSRGIVIKSSDVLSTML